MQDKPFCILGIAKINETTVDSAYRHNNRLMPVPSSKFVQTDFDISVKDQTKKFASERRSLRNRIDERLTYLGAKKTRKDSVLAIELLLSTANGFFNQDPDIAFDPKLNCNRALLNKWLIKCKKFLKLKFGDNLIQVSLHLDETTPHLHAFVMPLKYKVVQIPSKAQLKHSREEWRLCASDFMNKSWYRKMHDDYAQAMNEFGLVRGLLHSKSKNIDISDFVTLVKERKKVELELARLRQAEIKLSNETEKATEKNKLLNEQIDSLNQKKQQFIQGVKSIRDTKDKLEGIYKTSLAEASKQRKALSELKHQGAVIKSENDNLLRYQGELVETVIHDFGEHIAFSRDIEQIISSGIEEITTYSQLIPVSTEVRTLKSKLEELNEKLSERQQQFHLEHENKAKVSSGPKNSLNRLMIEKQGRKNGSKPNILK